MVTRETRINSQSGFAVTKSSLTSELTLPPNMCEVFLWLTSFAQCSLELTFSGWCGRYVCCDVLIVCQMGLYGGPVVCDVKWEFYYLCCAVLWEPLSYLALENGLREGSRILRLQNGQLIWTDICFREEWSEQRITGSLFKKSLICPLPYTMLS